MKTFAVKSSLLPPPTLVHSLLHTNEPGLRTAPSQAVSPRDGVVQYATTVGNTDTGEGCFKPFDDMVLDNNKALSACNCTYRHI